MAPRRFSPKDVLRETMLTHLAVAPDGSTAVYGRRTIDGNGDGAEAPAVASQYLGGAPSNGNAQNQQNDEVERHDHQVNGG